VFIADVIQNLREEGVLKDREVLYVGGIYVTTLWLGTVVICNLTLDSGNVSVEIVTNSEDSHLRMLACTSDC